MGIPTLRNEIEGCEEILQTAQLAEEHFQEHNRPLRIAVDEADWRFNNITPEKVAAIRRIVPEANPVEKAMFYRICNLLTLNIELVFVFDGPNCPAKRGRSAGRKVDQKDRELLKNLLEAFGIPYLEAPGEAEAQCCRLQTAGVVDAIWSQDSDCLLFGCTLWLRDHRVAKEKGYDNRNKGHTKKAAKEVRAVRSKDIQEKHRLKREGLVLFAMLAGGDYGKGLYGCGPDTALKAAQSGLGISLCNSKDQGQCKTWRDSVLVPFFARNKINIAVPDQFPDFKRLQDYNQPLVLSEGSVRNNAEISRDYGRVVNEKDLFIITGEYFNTWGEGYMDWVVPTLLIQYLRKHLTETNIPLPRENAHNIKLVGKRRAVAGSGAIQKIKFSPFGLTSIRAREFFRIHDPLRETFQRVDGAPLDPNLEVECEVPAYLLERVLPPEVMDATSNQTRKQQQKRHRQVDNHSPVKKARQSAQECAVSVTQDHSIIRDNPLHNLPQGPYTALNTTQFMTTPSILGSSRNNGNWNPSRGRGQSSGQEFDTFDQDEADLREGIRLSLEQHSNSTKGIGGNSRGGGSIEVIDLTEE